MKRLGKECLFRLKGHDSSGLSSTLLTILSQHSNKAEQYISNTHGLEHSLPRRGSQFEVSRLTQLERAMPVGSKLSPFQTCVVFLTTISHAPSLPVGSDVHKCRLEDSDFPPKHPTRCLSSCHRKRCMRMRRPNHAMSRIAPRNGRKTCMISHGLFCCITEKMFRIPHTAYLQCVQL